MLKLCKAKGYKYVKRMFLLYDATDGYQYFPNWEWCFASWNKLDNNNYFKTGWHYEGCYKTQAAAERAAIAYATKRGCTVHVFHHSQLVFGYDSEL